MIRLSSVTQRQPVDPIDGVTSRTIGHAAVVVPARRPIFISGDECLPRAAALRCLLPRDGLWLARVDFGYASERFDVLGRIRSPQGVLWLGTDFWSQRFIISASDFLVGIVLQLPTQSLVIRCE